MRFKIDENLPAEFAVALRSAGHEAMTVPDQGLAGHIDERIAEICRREGRIIVTLDLGFSNLKRYPPRDYPGFVVFRLRSQDKINLLAALDRLIPRLESEPIEHRLWIVEENRMRVRE